MLKSKIYYQSILFCTFLFISSCTSKPPIWVEKRPVENDFWHGIGFAQKDNNNFMDIARERAIHEIASQIKININSELDIIVKDYNGSLENFSSVEVAGIRSYDALSEIIVKELQTQLIFKDK